MEGKKQEEERLAGLTLVALTAIGIAFTAFSILEFYMVTGNVYSASYYSLLSIFDAEGITPLTNYVAPFTLEFYRLIIVLAADGIVKIVIIGLVMASFINIMSDIDIKSKLAGIVAKKISGHTVICGYSMLAERLCAELAAQKKKFIVVVGSEGEAEMLRSLGYQTVEGDFKSESVLRKAYIESARTVIFDAKDDFDNMIGVISAKHLNSRIKVITRVKDEYTVTKMHRAGADQCVVPEIVAGVELGNYIVSKLFR
ncbi:MAG: NAD-binding protein [Candidatus Marsarchaeota archaeon]|jgi:voltage-gated potassium channel|nr:NAD-binding protein [Candidatus Marsarchaeota archaeon]